MPMKLASWVSSQTFPQNNSAIGHQPGERLSQTLVRSKIKVYATF